MVPARRSAFSARRCQFSAILSQVALSSGSITRWAWFSHSCAFPRYSFARSTDMPECYRTLVKSPTWLAGAGGGPIYPGRGDCLKISGLSRTPSRMDPHRIVRLKVVTAPAIGSVVSAPPVLQASSHTIDYVCGGCGTVLMHAEDGQVHNLTIHCLGCGLYNSTNR